MSDSLKDIIKTSKKFKNHGFSNIFNEFYKNTSF